MHTLYSHRKKIVHSIVRLLIVGATFAGIYIFFVSVAAQPTSIRLSETQIDAGIVRSGTTKEKKLDITRQTSGDLPIGLTLSNTTDYSVIVSGATNPATITLPSAQQTISLTIRFQPTQEGIKTANLTITQAGASVIVKLTGRAIPTGTTALCPPTSSYWPQTGSRNMPTTLRLQWPQVTGASVSYTVYIDDDKDVTTNNDSGNTNMVKSGGDIILDSGSYTTALSGLLPNTTYYWIVEVTSGGSTVRCPRSAVLSFVTQKSTSPQGQKYEYPTEVIQFDSRIITNPPPGFTDERFRLPQTTEVIAN